MEISIQSNKSLILKKHCRFRLRSGREVFGIIWDIKMNGKTKYFFTSASAEKQLSGHVDYIHLNNLGVEIDINDVIFAENIAS